MIDIEADGQRTGSAESKRYGQPDIPKAYNADLSAKTLRIQDKILPCVAPFLGRDIGSIPESQQLQASPASPAR
jgi:hypothetical protein